MICMEGEGDKGRGHADEVKGEPGNTGRKTVEKHMMRGHDES